MIWLRWAMIGFAACLSGCAVYFLAHGDPGAGLLLLVCAVLSLPDFLVPTSLAERSSAGRVYGVPYYLEWDGHRQYFSADVYGYHATAPYERSIKEVIFRRLTQAVAHRAVDKMIGRLR